MIRDPLTTWDGPYPYEVLAAAGVTPEFTQAEIGKLTFTLMRTRQMNTRTQQAWHELRKPDRRLLADLLLYPVDLDKELPKAHAALAAELEDLEANSEPPEVTAALAVPEEWARGPQGGLTPLAEVSLPAPPAPAPPRFDAFPTAVPDHLIEFDR